LELEADLELLFVCGLHPYTPDMLMEADIVDGRVRIRYADYLAAPARLSPAEGLALLASARSLLDAPLADADTLDALRAAARDRRQVAMDYYAFGRDERRVRIVEPGGVFTTAGQWYLSAFCTEVEQNRVFRVDRIVELTILQRLATGPVAPAAPNLFQDTVLGQARLVLDRDASWVASQYPVHQVVALDDGRLEVTLPVQAYAWLDRLLMRLGPHAQLVDAPAGYPGLAVAASAIASRHG
jgi:proteasome accessory factor C